MYARTVLQIELSTCSPADAHSDWVGLGGWDGRPLLQNGIASAGNVSGFFAWWEALNSSHDTFQVTAPLTVHTGDVVSMSTTYNKTAKTVTFSWHNQTTGKVVAIGPMASIETHDSVVLPTWEFYDGSTGEVIDERPEVGGVYDKIRNFGSQSWDQARVYANGSTSYSGIRSVPHLGPTMTNDAQTKTLVTPTGTTTEAFRDSWDQCGAVEAPPT